MEPFMDKIAKYNIGDLVIHKRIRYRAIVIDVDPIFQASGKYNPRATQHEFATRNPWYRLLVDDSSQITYVEECQLLPDTSQEPINNPNIDDYLIKNKGSYQKTIPSH
ncbi:TPA: heat shock protein HspQ [Legionella pneumophila]|nr:heat shock protein HspQ [Legionella pneumophila]HAT8831980.1 heat shock protein HspQ [Legionella pneumophila subsp. pneumophila]HAT8727738.1 heat shock protein HspQ [Legionella pneumophila]HAU0852089.1 heat shock protein HspQ [Legionella pneumophila]HAU0941120.1 heat shock protein HspQ [Legionella pneumophila]